MIFDRGNNMVKVVFYELTVKRLKEILFMKLLQTFRGTENGDNKSDNENGDSKSLSSDTVKGNNQQELATNWI